MQSDRSEPAAPRVIVHILKGKSARKAREMRGATLLVGSDPHCDVQMRSPQVAGRHCLICRRDGAITVQALDADFPITVNGSLTTAAPLADGDRLTVGPFEIGITVESNETLEVVEGPAAQRPPLATAPAVGESASEAPATFPHPRADEPAALREKAPLALPVESMAKLAQLNERQEQLDRHQQQLAEQRAALDETYKEQARRECALAEQSERLLRQQTQLRLSEQELEHRRLQHTEDLLNYDRQKKTLDEQRAKTQRVRRRLVEKYRDRHRALKHLAGQIEQKAADLEARTRSFDRDLAQFQQLRLETESKSQQLSQEAISLADRGIEIERREKELSAQSMRLEQDLSNLNIRERALLALQSQVAEEKTRLAEQDALAYANRQQAEQQFQAAERRTREIERLAQALENERQTQEKQQQHLREVARGIEQQRVQSAHKERDLAARQAELEAHAAELASERQQLEECERGLAARENAVAEQARLVQETETELRRRGDATAATHAELERQAEALRVEQQALEQQRRELHGQIESYRRDKERHEIEKARWTSRWQESRERIIEAEERLAIAQSLTQETDVRALQLSKATAELADQSRSFAVAQERFAAEQHQLEDLLNAANRKALELEREQKRLAKDREEIEHRRTQVVERERQWIEEVGARRAELKAQTDHLQQERHQLEQQSAVHRRHVERFRQVAARTVERRRALQKKLARLETTAGKEDSAAASTAPNPPAIPAKAAAPPKLPQAQVRFPSLGAATILGVVHHGTMATTYRASHPDYSGPVVLRLLAARWCRDANLRNSYATSVKSATAFRHPNAAAVYQFFQHEDRFGLIRELVPGCSVAEMLGKPISPRLVVHLCRQAVSALAAAQAGGFVHRGLQPSRLILTPGGVLKILAYGEPFWVRQFYRCEKGRSASAYCAPEEMAVDRGVDVRGDLFAIGRIVTELAAGKGAEPSMDGKAVPNGFPPAFAAILAQLTASDPSQRCRSLRELLGQLDEILDDPRLLGEAKAHSVAG